ncbi:sulfurtransferase [Wukongibacter baidiensis]|uniref:sulfurtransferase n=1 Tax=Wukongibacter baidiensis TaxID=1723361 RepID=UPI003D7F67BE
MNKKVLKVLLISVISLFMLVGCAKGANNTSQISNGTYADPSYIEGVDWLNENIGKDNILILDARGEKEYEKGHIPGAVNVAWQSFANMDGKPGDKGWGVVLDAQRLSKALSNIGVDKERTIIVYSDTKNGWGEDGRFVWLMRMAGLENSKILNGGFNLWKEKGYEVSKERTNPKASDFTVEELNLDYTADTDWVKSNIETAKVLDSRSKEEYNGATKFGEARGGHLSGAIHMPYTSLLNEDGTLKSQKELDSMFSEAGINKDDEIATYCTAGIRSAHLAIVLRMVGYVKARNYDESFYTWAAEKSLDLE